MNLFKDEVVRYQTYFHLISIIITKKRNDEKAIIEGE